MKKILLLTFSLTFLLSIHVSAQLRDNLSYPNYTTSIINTKAPTIQNSLNNFFTNNVKMSHSYSMSFGSYGGSFQNINAYTNTLEFSFSPKLNGRLDVSFLHSPFGSNNLYNAGSVNGIGSQVIIRNAELNYQLNDKTFIQLQYQQIPSGFGYYNPFGSNRLSSWY